MQASIVMNIINVAGDILFIFGFHWGVAGAALASLISRMTACVILVIRLHNTGLEIHVSFGRLRWNSGMIGKILHIGIPGGIENSIFQLGRVLVVSIIALFGTTQIAANAVANNLDGMGVLPGQAMNLAMITVIGRCVGAGDFEQAEYYTKKMMKLTYLISGLCCLGVILTMPLTMKLYGLSEETLKLAAVLVRILALLLFVPRFGIEGVLWSILISQLLLCMSGLLAVSRYIHPTIGLDAYILKPAAAMLLSTGGIYLLKPLSHFMIFRSLSTILILAGNLCLCAILYILLLLSFGIWKLFTSARKFFYLQSQ